MAAWVSDRALKNLSVFVGKGSVKKQMKPGVEFHFALPLPKHIHTHTHKKKENGKWKRKGKGK